MTIPITESGQPIDPEAPSPELEDYVGEGSAEQVEASGSLQMSGPSLETVVYEAESRHVPSLLKDNLEEPAVERAELGILPATQPVPDVDPPRGTPGVSQHAGANFGTMIGKQILEAVRVYSGLPLPPSWINEQLAGYTPPGNEHEAFAKLEANNVVVLSAGRPGSGRWTTALKLLRKTPGVQVIRRVRREAGDQFTMSGFRDSQSTGWILDLRAPDEGLPQQTTFGLELARNQALRDTRSYLVVVVGTELWRKIGTGATHLTEVLQPPGPTDVLVSHLAHREICHDPDKWVQDPDIAKSLTGLVPGQVRSWAETIEQVELDYQAKAIPGELPDEAFRKKVDAVIKSHAGWRDVIAEWHSQRGRTSFERNYLLTMAVYDGVFGDSPVEDVHVKVASLTTALGELATDHRGQEGPGLVELAGQAGAILQPDGVLRFPGPGYAEGVTDYFWLDRPHLLEQFTKWTVGQCLQLDQLHQAALADKVIPWVLHHARTTRSTSFLRSVATQWSEESQLVDRAVQLLTVACLDPEIGQLVRNATGDWIGQARTTVALKLTLGRVFEGLASSYPKSTLRRLADLGESPQPEIGEAVGAVIKALWTDPDLRSRLDELLTSWSASTRPEARRAAANAFLWLAFDVDGTGRPALLAGGTAEASWIVDSWRRVLEDDLNELAFKAGSAWLDAMTASPEQRDAIVNVFVRAVHDTPVADRRGTRTYNLMRIAEEWRIRGSALDEQRRNQFRADLVDSIRASAASQTSRESPGGE